MKLLLSAFLALAATLPGAHGHGRLVNPVTRKGDTGYEDDPVPSLTSDDFVCRHPDRNEAAVTAITAGTTSTLTWRFGAAHVGDCAVYISYDVDKPRSEQKYFKIANMFDCKVGNNVPNAIEYPSWLPPGQAIVRWEWTALHVYPSVEFYSQCFDANIFSQSTKSPADIPSYSINNPPIYPANGNTGVGFRNPFNPSSSQFMTGPACVATLGNKNGCALTAPGTEGNTGGGGGDNVPDDPNAGVTDPEDIDTGSGGSGKADPICEVYTVVSGDTLSKIATYYQGQGVDVSWQQICEFNSIIDNCDAINIGDTYIIPGTCEEEDEEGGGGGGAGKMIGLAAAALVIGGVGALAIKKYMGRKPSKANAFKAKENDML